MPLRLGLLTHLHVGDDTGWVAQHHFLNGGIRPPTQILKALEHIASEVAPTLGWRSTTRTP